MFSKSFKIVEPKRFEVYIEDVNMGESEAVVRVDNIAVCKADLRYYIGNRDVKVLGSKYPMNLIHEATGTIVKVGANEKELNLGDRVVLVPNIIDEANCEDCKILCHKEDVQENFCPKAKFASSNHDGFSKEFVTFPIRNLVKVHKEKYSQVYTLCELISVAVAAIRRCTIKEGSRVAIWGDGVVGYITASVLKAMYKCEVSIIGKNKEKIELFHCDHKYLIGDYKELNDNFDIAFECVGGVGAENAIRDIISNITVGGTIILTGVTETEVAISTRKILEKGLRILGTTRSNVKDFETAVKLLDNEKFKKHMGELILKYQKVNNIDDFYQVFEAESKNRNLGKYIMNFNI